MAKAKPKPKAATKRAAPDPIARTERDGYDGSTALREHRLELVACARAMGATWTGAAENGGFAAGSAGRLSSHPNVLARAAWLRNQITASTMADQMAMVRSLIEYVQLDLTEVFDFDENDWKHPSEWPPEARAALTDIRVSRDKIGIPTVNLQFFDKQKAVELIAKIAGMLERGSTPDPDAVRKAKVLVMPQTAADATAWYERVKAEQQAKEVDDG